ncbi:MAG: MoaD/ThiS family protein [Zestosphaera sp.]
MVKVVVTFIGALADSVGTHMEVVELQSGYITVKDLIEHLTFLKPSLNSFLSMTPLIQVFVNDVEASYNRALRDGDRVTLMSPLYEGG